MRMVFSFLPLSLLAILTPFSLSPDLVIYSVGLSLLRCIPLGEPNQRDFIPDTPLRETESHSNLFVPVLRGTDLRGKR